MAEHTESAPSPTVVAATPIVRIENFLAPVQVETLLARCVDARHRFVPSTVTSGEPGYRESLILFDVDSVAPGWAELIRAVLPLLQRAYQLPERQPDDVELQLTVHGDGGYFKVHQDNATPDTASRTISFVYYFASDTASFSGGELLIHDSPVAEPGRYVSSFHTVTPTLNSLVCFPSGVWHEVRPVTVPGDRFEDGRFTVNGWLRWTPEPTDVSS